VSADLLPENPIEIEGYSLPSKTLPFLHQFFDFNMKRKAETQPNDQNGTSILKKRAKTSMNLNAPTPPPAQQI